MTGRYSNQLNYRSSFSYPRLQDLVTLLQAMRHFYETPLNPGVP
ncbi:conserved hypothetical protein [Burkholderia cepacia]